MCFSISIFILGRCLTRSIPLQTKFRGLFKQVLVDAPIARAKEQARALGYRFPEDAGKPATPSPPNSVADPAFTGGVKNVKSLPPSHVLTRKKSLREILAVRADDDGSGREDSDSENEPEPDEL